MRVPLSFSVARRASLTFFMVPGLVYGLFVSRLPAFKLALGIDQGQLGLMLLSLGIGSVLGLMLAPVIMRRTRPGSYLLTVLSLQ